MGDIILFLFVVVVLTTVWIEWLPRKYDILIGVVLSIMIIGIGIGWMPEWYGAVVTVIGIANLAWQYRKGVREFGWPQLSDLLTRASRTIRALLVGAAGLLKETIKLVARIPVPEKIAPPSRPRMPPRIWIGGFALTVFSPIAAIPAAIVLAMVLTIVNATLVDSGSLVFGSAQIVKSVLGNAFVIQVATLDLVIRGFLLTGPIFLVAGVIGAKWADRSGCYWQRLLRVSVVIGALYPSIFIVASTMGWFDEPFLT